MALYDLIPNIHNLTIQENTKTLLVPILIDYPDKTPREFLFYESTNQLCYALKDTSLEMNLLLHGIQQNLILRLSDFKPPCSIQLYLDKKGVITPL